MMPLRFSLCLRFATSVVAGIATVAASGLAAEQGDLETLRSLDLRLGADGLENRIASALVSENAGFDWEAALLEVATDPEATLDGRRLACDLLRLCATSHSTEPLAPLLTDPRLSHDARMVLERLDDRAVDTALMEALEATRGNVQLGVIDSLALRRTADAVPLLRRVVDTSSESANIEAAFRALGQIATPEAVEFFIKTPPPEGLGTTALRTAYSLGAADLLDDGLNHLTREQVWILFERLRLPSNPLAVRAAAIGAALKLDPRGVKPLVMMLRSEDPASRALGGTFIARLAEDPVAVESLLEAAVDLDPEGQALVIHGLTARGDKAVVSFAREQMNAAEEPLQLAAVRALGELGDVSDLDGLLLLIEANDPLGSTVQAALARLPDPAADERLIEEFQRGAVPVRIELVEIITNRGLRAAVPVLLAQAVEADYRLGAATYRAIGELATPAEVPQLLRRMETATSRERGPISRSIVSIGRRFENGEVSGMLVARWEEAEGAEATFLMRMIGATGDEFARDFLLPFVEQDEPDENALRLLAAWRDVTAFPILHRLVERPDYPEDARLAAWQGMLRLSSGALDDWNDDGMTLWETTFQAAPTIEEQKAVIRAGEGFLREPMVEWLAHHADHPQLAAEFQAAHERMVQTLRGY